MFKTSQGTRASMRLFQQKNLAQQEQANVLESAPDSVVPPPQKKRRLSTKVTNSTAKASKTTKKSRQSKTKKNIDVAVSDKEEEDDDINIDNNHVNKDDDENIDSNDVINDTNNDDGGINDKDNQNVDNNDTEEENVDNNDTEDQNVDNFGTGVLEHLKTMKYSFVQSQNYCLAQCYMLFVGTHLHLLQVLNQWSRMEQMIMTQSAARMIMSYEMNFVKLSF